LHCTHEFRAFSALEFVPPGAQRSSLLSVDRRLVMSRPQQGEKMRFTTVMVLTGFVLGGCLSEIEPISSIDPLGAVGAVTLTWQPPTLNQNGSPLLDLAGYYIYIGTSSNSYRQKIRLDNPGLTTYVVEDLSAGTYYFVATSYNSSGVESLFSREAVKTVN